MRRRDLTSLDGHLSSGSVASVPVPVAVSPLWWYTGTAGRLGLSDPVEPARMGLRRTARCR